MSPKRKSTRDSKTPKTCRPTRNSPRRRPPPPAPLPPAEPDSPHWLVDDGRWINMPENMRQLAARILNPAYRRFVLDARNELERSVGMTLVHLMWLELFGQVELGKTITDKQSVEAILHNPEELIERHLRLTASKCQTAELLLKLRMVDGLLRQSSFSAPDNPPALASPEEGISLPRDTQLPSPSPFTQSTGEY